MSLLLINHSVRIIFERWYSYVFSYSTKNRIVSLTSHSGISTRPFSYQRKGATDGPSFRRILLHIYRSMRCRVSSCLSSCILILFSRFIHRVFSIRASLRGKAVICRDIEHTWTNLAVSYPFVNFVVRRLIAIPLYEQYPSCWLCHDFVYFRKHFVHWMISLYIVLWL